MIICRHIVMKLSKAEQVARLVREAGVFRPRELDRVGIPRQYLRQAKDRGLVRQVGRGLYVADGNRVTEHHTLVEATKRVPHGIVCLLSALRFHGLTTQSPHEVWIAIAHKARRPRADYPPMRIVHFSGEALSYGVKEKKLEGMIVRVFDPAKTVAAAFRPIQRAFQIKMAKIDVAVQEVFPNACPRSPWHAKFAPA